MDSLPPETINATLETHDSINEWMDRHDIYGEERAQIHDMLDQAVRTAHMYALAGAGARILTTSEVAERLNISVDTLRKRLAEADPPISPVKKVGMVNLYMVEDLPAIATLHMQGVIADGLNTRYVAARIRKAISSAKHGQTRKRLQKAPSVRWPDIDGRPRVYRIEVAQQDAKILDATAKQEGWPTTENLTRALVLAYLEGRKGRT